MSLRRCFHILPVLLCITIVSCGRRKLRPDELERNRLFAEMVYRQDHRTLGNDDFFERTLLASQQPAVSKWAAMALGRIGDPRALPWLYPSLRLPDAEVRASAAFSIGEIEDRQRLKTEARQPDLKARPALVRLLSDPAPLVRMRALQALGKSGAPADLPAILDCVRQTPIDVVPERQAFLDAAIVALMRIGDPSALPLLRSLAVDPDPQVQWRAANALARMRDRSARPLFLQLLKSPDADVRAYAVRGLSVCGVEADSLLLVPLLATHSRSEGNVTLLPLRISAVEALASLGSADSVPEIIKALQAEPIDDAHPGQVNFAVSAAAALGQIGGPRAAAALVPLLSGPAAVQYSAVVGLARAAHKDPGLFFDAVRGFDFKKARATCAWARALGELGGPAACRELTAVLARALQPGPGSDSHVAVPAILEALRSADVPDFDSLLRPFLQSESSVVLCTALRLYEPQAGDTKPWRPGVLGYRRIGDRNDVESKVCILNCLRPWVGETGVQELLRAALGDRSRRVRLAAAALLRSAGAPDVPDDPGPAESNLTRLACNVLATTRLDRTVAIIQTGRGNIEIELFREDAPVTASAFVNLARSGFYDGLTFVREGRFSVVQGGDPCEERHRGPGDNLQSEINTRPFERGSVGMVLAGRDGARSRFCIILSPRPDLDGTCTCFGRVISGIEAADRIAPGDVIKSVRIEDDVTMFDYRRY
jgi:HEAT repeat protein/cyclophilin family peptidyl-prolyl cis-trans isomerase